LVADPIVTWRRCATYLRRCGLVGAVPPGALSHLMRRSRHLRHLCRRGHRFVLSTPRHTPPSSFHSPPPYSFLLQIMMSLILLSLLLLRTYSGACTAGIVVGIYGAVVVGQVEPAPQANQNAGGRVSTGGGIIFSVPGTRCSGWPLFANHVPCIHCVRFQATPLSLKLSTTLLHPGAVPCSGPWRSQARRR
jgi:hypothetical protein